MRPYRKSSYNVHDLKVHLIWITKYRYKVLSKDISIRIREIIRRICDSKDIQIIKGNISQDHVHIYVSYPPKISVSEMVRFFKGRSSKKIQEEFPQLSRRYWGKHFWGIGCVALSSGHVTDEMIRNYIENHRNDPNHNNDDFKIE
ncbi:MAG: IS200/IS605 family transposase [Candidatus Electrothrix sp. YB6]